VSSRDICVSDRLVLSDSREDIYDFSK
jgi:hypothetical protein